ncbi:MAG: carboxypeptidase-like regulatory domain-containing protein [Bacteroidetes bacterium]|nr:carboxypeptidase-like regulatory domain-containing protein [Bacteroidota bacterium]
MIKIEHFLLLIILMILGLNVGAQSLDTSKILGDSISFNQPRITTQDSISTIEIAVKKQGIERSFNGVIKDINTGEGIPFATVFIPGTGLGTSADINGNFSFTDPHGHGDTLRIQAVGYTTQNKKLEKGKNEFSFYIELLRTDNTLEEFVLRPGEDPAVVLMRQIIAHKPENNPDRTQNYGYEIYNKLEVDLQRLSKEQFEKLPIPYMRKFSFIYKNMDSTSEKSPFLPFYLTETLSDYYFQRSPKKTREFIKASQMKGVKNESITQFMGGMYQNINSYNNFIPVFDKQFVSPISNQGLFYYKYRIKDTQQAYGHDIILVQFTPRRNGENCFYGDFWVVDSIYALQRINMEVPKDANINWVNRVSLYQEFAPIKDTLWFCTKDKFIADFVAPYGAKLPGFIGRKTTTYQNILVNDTSVLRVLSNPKIKDDVTIADSSKNKSEAFWTTARHDTLNKNERAIYHMIDTLETLPFFIRYKNLIKFFTTGKKEFGPIELGPYWNVYSSNPIEGRRFRFSMGTTAQLMKHVHLEGYLAYGTKDQEWKYKLSGLWLIKKHPRASIRASYVHDIDRSTSSYDQVSNDNIFSRIFRKPGIPWKMAMVDELRAEWKHEYYGGFSHSFMALHRVYDPYAPLPDVNIFHDDNGKPSDRVTSTEIAAKLRFAYKEKFLDGNFNRISLGSKYPILEMRIGLGLNGIWNSGYSYKKISLTISDKFKIAPLGEIQYDVFGGRIFGTLPYPLLEIHPGNEFFYFNKHSFNMMNRYEFVSDRYAGLNIEHNIGGGVFNYIPYLKKLKMRQFWTAKVLYGNLSEANKLLNLNKGYTFRTLDKDPYIELGTGVSNILQLFRIDFVWRVSPNLLPNEGPDRYFGIFGSVQFNF